MRERRRTYRQDNCDVYVQRKMSIFWGHFRKHDFTSETIKQIEQQFINEFQEKRNKKAFELKQLRHARAVTTITVKISDAERLQFKSLEKKYQELLNNFCELHVNYIDLQEEVKLKNEHK